MSELRKDTAGAIGWFRSLFFPTWRAPAASPSQAETVAPGLLLVLQDVRNWMDDSARFPRECPVPLALASRIRVAVAKARMCVKIEVPGLPREEWERRFKGHIVNRLAAQHGAAPDSGWTQERAEDAARAEFEASEFEDLYRGYEADPEGSADEALSYWSDGT